VLKIDHVQRDLHAKLNGFRRRQCLDKLQAWSLHVAFQRPIESSTIATDLKVTMEQFLRLVIFRSRRLTPTSPRLIAMGPPLGGL